MEGIGRTVASIGAAVGAGALIKSSIQLAAEAETAGVQFEILTGSAEKAAKIIADMRKLDQESPLAFTDFQQAAKTMIGFGVSSDDVIKRMRQLSAISMGNAERMNSLSLAFAQTTAAGRLMGQEVLQFVNSGFNPLQQISKQTGESMVELKKRLEAGGISAYEVGRAFDFATGKGGLFYGMNEKIAQTTAGQLAKLQGDFKLLSIELGNALVPVLKESVELIRQFTSPDGAAGGFLSVITDGIRVFTSAAGDMMTGEVGRMAALTGDIEERNAQEKAKSFLHTMTKEEKEKRDKILEMREEERQKVIQVQRTIEDAMQADMDALEISIQKLEILEKEVELQKQKNAGINTEIELKAKDMGHTESQRQKAKEMLLEIERLKDAPIKEARAKALLEVEGSFENLFSPLIEAAKLMQEGFIGKTDFEALTMRTAMEEAKRDVVQRRDTPTAMAGSVEAYRLFLERDQDNAREIELAERSNQFLQEINDELKTRGLLGVAKR